MRCLSGSIYSVITALWVSELSYAMQIKPLLIIYQFLSLHSRISASTGINNRSGECRNIHSQLPHRTAESIMSSALELSC